MMPLAWWKQAKLEKHGQIFADLDALRNIDQNGRMSNLAESLGQYLDRDIPRNTDLARWRSMSLDGGAKQLHLNVSKSALDSVASKIAPHKGLAMFATVAGRWKDRLNARLLEQWSEGFMHREKYDEVTAPDVFIDGGIFGSSAIKYVDDDDGETFHIERAWPGSLWFDEIGAAYAEPRVMFEVRYMHRHQAAEKWPEYEEMIDAAPDKAAEESGVTIDEVIEVVEAWQLPSKKGADDGFHVVCIDGATLEERPWTMDKFPFRFWRWSKSPLGFWGLGLMEELRGIQEEVNKLLMRIQDSMHVNATSVCFIHQNSAVDPNDLTNLPGQVVTFKGQIPPTYALPPSMAAEVYNHLWRLRDAAFEIAGVSQMTAGGKPPPNVESMVAFEYLDENETRRFALVAGRWQSFRLEVVEGAVEYQREVFGDKGGKVKWGEGTIVDEIDWKDIDLKRDAYVLRAYPVNFLPSTPAGKMRKVEKLASIQIGDEPLFSAQEVKSLLDFPDLRKAMDLGTSSF